MKAKEYLNQLKTIQAKTERKLEEINMLRTMVESTTSPLGKDFSIHSSGNQDKFANIIAKICDIETELEDLVAKKFDIICKIEEIEDANAFKAIYFKYVNGMKAPDICDKMEIAEPTLYRYLTVGYKEIDEILKKTESDRKR